MIPGSTLGSGYEQARVSLRVPQLPAATSNAAKDAQAFDNWRWSTLQFLMGLDPKLLLVPRDDSSPLTRAQLKVVITPPPVPLAPASAGSLSTSSSSSTTATATSTTASATYDPHAAQRVAVRALGGDPTFEELLNCLPEQVQVQLQTKFSAILAEATQRNTEALLVIRRAGNAPHEKWAALCQRYAHLGAISAATLIHQLNRDRLTSKEKPEVWLDAYCHRFTLLQERKQAFSDQYKCINLIQKLETAKHLPFSDFGLKCYYSKDDAHKPTFIELAAMAREQMQAMAMTNEHKKAVNGLSGADVPTLFYANDRGGQSFGGACWNCGNAHRLAKCRVRCKRPECTNKPRHLGAECKVRGPGRRNKNGNNNNSRNNQGNNNQGNNNRNNRNKSRRGNKNAQANVADAEDNTTQPLDDAWSCLAVEEIEDDALGPAPSPTLGPTPNPTTRTFQITKKVHYTFFAT